MILLNYVWLHEICFFFGKRYETNFKQYGKTKFNTLEISCNAKLVPATQNKLRLNFMTW